MSTESVRPLPEKASLDKLRKQAKDLRVSQGLPTLAVAQFELAKSYGFASWPKLVFELRQREVRRLIHIGDNDALSAFVAKYPKLASAPYTDGSTPVHLAAEYNDPAAIEVLVKAGAPLQARYEGSGHNALSWAITCWSDHAAYKLIQLGLMPDLFCAAGLGLTDVVKLFWNPDGSLKAHSSQTGSSRYDESGKRLPLGQSEAEMLGDALYIACRNGRLEASRWLLDHGADPNWLGYIGGSCLHWAEFSQNTELCALLRERGAREDLLDAQFKATPRQFPVMVLAGWGFTDALERYLTAHPDAVKTQTEAGTPLDVATANGHARAVTILRSHGA